MKVAIGCLFYNCYAELDRLLNSIPKGFIQYFIGIDGVYRYTKEQNPELPELSTDGSRELILENSKKFIPVLVDKPNNLEFNKRNAYLETCEKLGDVDVLIIVDSDEYFLYPEATEPETAFFRFKQNIEKAIMDTQQNHNIFAIRTLNLNESPPYESYHPRIWYRPGEMRYLNGSHYYYANIVTEKNDIELFDSQRYNYVQYSHSVVKGVILAHSHALRSKQHMQMRADYIPYLIRFEGLTQSHKFTLEESHKLAAAGKSYEDILRGEQNTTRVST
ncbi:MAG: hypothetical protein ACM3X1_02635 [Ignavibacteriales bacterium]